MNAIPKWVTSLRWRGIVSCLAVVLGLTTTPAVNGQTINVGSSTDLYNAIQTIDSNPANNYTLNVTSGFTVGQQLPGITTNATVTLSGNSNSIDGANLYQPLVVNSGNVTLQNLNIINAGQPVTVNGGLLTDTTGNLQGPVVNNGGVIFNETASDTYSGNMSGSGGVEITGTGAVTFTGLNSYTGGTFIAFGSSLIGTTSSLQGVVFNNGAVQFNQATNGVYASSMFGAGSVEISGGGTVTFSGANSYLGGTTVDAGSTLVGTTTSLQGQFTDNGFVQINQSLSGTYGGNISGTGGLGIVGGGPITLTGLNTYTGGTSVASNNTLIGTTGSLQGNIINSGLVQFSQSTIGNYKGDMSGSGSVEISGGGTVIFTGQNSYTGGSTVDSGSTLSGTTNALQGAFNDNGVVQFSQSASGNFAGTISGAGSVEISNSGAVTFSGATSYTGGTTIDSGSTLIGSTDAIQGNISNNGNLQFTGGGSGPIIPTFEVVGETTPVAVNPITFPGPYYTPDPSSGVFTGNISGTGHVEINTGGVIGFTGTNTYTGGTTVDNGSTLLGSTTSVQGNITNNGFVHFNNTNWSNNLTYYPYYVSNGPVAQPLAIVDPTSLLLIAGTYSGNMSGTGGVEISGNVPIIFSGTNSYTGATTVDAWSQLIGTTNSLQGAIVNYGAVQFSQSASGTYAGNMSGSGSVEISGTGPVTFSGVNSYSGGTTVDSGSTLIGTTKSLQGQIFDNGLIQFNQTTAGIFASNISGSGMVEVAGVGPVTFTGTNSTTGGTAIENGSTLIVGSTGSITGNVMVNNGGTLMGSGTVGSTTVNAGGTIYPGTIGAPLTINGNFVQGAGSTFSAELSPTGGDKIIVNGSATVNNATNLNLVLDSGTYTVGSKYQILTTAGDTTPANGGMTGGNLTPANGLTGTYATMSTSPYSQNILFTQEYSANSLQIDVKSNIGILATTSNQFAVASVIDQTSGSATGNYASAITQLTTLNSGQMSSALNQLSGDIYPSISTIERQTTSTQMQLLSNRLAGLTGPGIPSVSVAQRTNGIRFVSSQSSDASNPATSIGNSGSSQPTWTSWAQGYGLGGSVGGDGNAGGVNYRLGGTLFGVERWIGENTMIGVLGGYAGTSIGNRQDGSSAQINNYQVGLYELHREDWLYISNIDAYSNSSYNVSRPISLGTIQETASGSSSGNQWAHYTELGGTSTFDEIRLQPFIGVQYMYLDQQGYSESGAGSMDLTTSNQIVNSVRNSFGGRMYLETMLGSTLIVPSLSARYQHEWGNGTQLITSSFSGAPTAQFTTSGNHTGRDFGLFSLAATAYVTERFSLYGTVDAQVATNYNAIIGSGGFQFSW